ncbi:uncharacterized protein LOC111866074 isoform X3 [Cryptotermes secundus]|uniref:uncharacterized protein LOC111866074 isoform X3 n=1 Tax=Cryptotermes secundus TaxID=105785 RepID=UPI001454D245|nr:uncharacterized protein LOC111866074 isoform X3 [Cryptotermes secundus]
MEEMGRAVLLLTVVASTVSALQLWLPGTEVVYQWETSLEAVTLFPAPTVSQWNMSGKVVVQGAEDLATVQLQDLEVSAYNGPSISDTPVVKVPIPEEASQLLQPFIIHYHEGQVVSLTINTGEEQWAINMKRGLASLLQLDLSHMHTPAFVSTESSQYGCCKVEYSVHNQSNGTVAVQKFVDFPSCEDFPVQSFGNVQRMLCPSGVPQETVSSGSTRAYVLEPLGPGGHLLIHSVQADGLTHLQQSNSYFLQSWITLHLQWQDKMVMPLTMKGGGERVGLTHQLPGADVSQGRSPPSQKNLLTTVIEILGELADGLDEQHLELNLEKLHEEHVVHALYLLSMLEQASLWKLYLELEVGTSYRHETLRNLFLEMLPLVGSHDSIMLVRDLVMTGTVKNDTSIQLLSSIPFSVRQPSEELLTDLEVLLSLPEDTLENQAAVLSFATLVHKVCSAKCAPETLDKYVGQYMDLFTGSRDHARQMLYLEALSNFELQRVAQFLAPIISGDDTKYSRHIRILAMWTSVGHATLQPDQAHYLYWPLLTNSSEHLEVRVAALTVLILSKPISTHLYNVMLFMMHERDPHLKHFWYTTLHSLVHTRHPCYRHLGEEAKKLVQFIPEPEVHHWATGNYMLDYTDPDYRFGFLAHLIMVANPRTGLPNVFYQDVGSHTKDFSYNQFSIYIRLDGVEDTIKRQLLQARSFNFTELVTLLHQLEVPIKPSEPVHVELLVRAQNKAVVVHYANQSTLNSFFKVLRNVQLLAIGGIHLNAQNVIMPFLVEEMRVTDLGTNAFLQTSAGGLMSVRANFTASQMLSSDLELRSMINSQTSFIQYNPVLNMWHGVQRSLNIQMNVPFSLRVSSNATEQSIKFSFQQTPGEEVGLVTHIHTAVFVKGVAVATKLKSHCATCPAHMSVTRNTPHSLLIGVIRAPVSSTLPDWDLGILYEHSPAFRKHRLTAELTIQGRDKVCVNLTVNFTEPPDTVISLTHPRLQSASAMLTAVWGLPIDGGQCPCSSSLQVLLDGQVTTEQLNLTSKATVWPYNMCQQDMQDVHQWGSHYMPLTRACYEVAYELATLRYYNISISSRNHPAWMDAVRDFLPSKMASVLSSNISIHLRVPPEVRPVLTVNGYKMLLGSAVGTKLQSWLINTQFPSLLQLVTNTGIVGSCVLTLHSVWTLDGAHLTTNVTTCYTLAMADCTTQPQFAVFIRKVEGTATPLAMELYSDINRIEVLPTADQLTISVNGQMVPNPHEGYQHPVKGDSYVFKVWQRSDGPVQIHLGEANVWLEYYGHFATVSVLGLYHGGLCGLCGDHNIDAGDDTAQVITMPCTGTK